MTRLTTIALASALAGASSAALADAPAAADAPNTATTNDNSLVVPKGKLVLDAFLEMDLSSGAVFKPVSLTPDLWYGVNDDVTVGLVHSGEGATGFIGAIGNSLCLTGSSNGCAHFYDDVGVDARIRLVRPWAVDVGLYINNISDPFQLAAKLGISGRWSWNKVSLELQPSLFVGLTNRNPPTMTVMGVTTSTGRPNAEELFVPVTVSYAVAPKVAVALQPGLALPFTSPGDTWAIPISLAARYAATPKLGIGLAFSFFDLIGGSSSADLRSLTLGGTYAF